MTVTPTITEAAHIKAAETALARVRRSGWPAHRPDVIEAADATRDAVETYHDIRTGRTQPEIDDDLDGFSRALGEAAQAAADWAAELGRLVPAEASDDDMGERAA